MRRLPKQQEVGRPHPPSASHKSTIARNDHGLLLYLAIFRLTCIPARSRMGSGIRGISRGTGTKIS
jgi:hypothetical protein